MAMVTIKEDEYKSLLESHKELMDIHTDPGLVLITKERCQQLLDASKTLNALYAAGVNNWEGYDIALDSLEK